MAITPKIHFVLDPTNQDMEFLTQKINEDTVNYGDVHNFAFFMRDQNGEIIAGSNAFIICGAVHTDQLWVHKNYRKQGLGCKLMEKIHEYGRENECTFATVNTMSFLEAVKFYERLGYERDFERSGYSKGSSHIFFKLKL
jgi:ribosomal protein S18 acetylase RimI-like enzyme